jgi:hypothetical protein
MDRLWQACWEEVADITCISPINLLKFDVY